MLNNNEVFNEAEQMTVTTRIWKICLTEANL